MNVQEYLDSLRKSFTLLEDEEREAVLVEVRDYIDQDSERIRNISPGMSKEEGVRLAIEEFGPASDIALIYNKNSQVMSLVNQRTGDVLLDMPEMSGKVDGKLFATGARGIRAIISYRRLSAVAGVAVLVMVMSAVWMTGQDVELAGEAAEPLMQYGGLTSEPLSFTESDTFVVSADDSGATFMFDLRPETGCLDLTVINPSGVTVLDTGDLCGVFAADWTFDGVGEWTVEVTYTDFTGSVSLDVFAAE
jgi:hypothetical protein